MTTEPLQNRFDFPHPNRGELALMWRIVRLMMDGARRSKLEIIRALNADQHYPKISEAKEIGARIRDAKRAENGAWPFVGGSKDEWEWNDSRDDGPDDDGEYRWQMKRKDVTQ